MDYINIPHKIAYNLKGKKADYSDLRYGDDELNNFDIWLAMSSEPTPLVLYIHGGGFVVGDKSKYHQSEDLVRFLDAGVSVATINYRFMNTKPYGILKSFHDAKRCLQYIRYHAEKFNIDKEKIACSGGSAGAGISLWLNFSNDMANLESSDPIERESTRLTCAGAFATQFTYDIFQWNSVFNIDMTATDQQKAAIKMAFGIENENVDMESQHEIREKLDFLRLMDKNDPPIFVNNYHKDSLHDLDALNHHPLHAKKIKERADLVGLRSIIYAPHIGIVDPSGLDVVDFFLQEFKS